MFFFTKEQICFNMKQGAMKANTKKTNHQGRLDEHQRLIMLDIHRGTLFSIILGIL